MEQQGIWRLWQKRVDRYLHVLERGSLKLKKKLNYYLQMNETLKNWMIWLKWEHFEERREKIDEATRY